MKMSERFGSVPNFSIQEFIQDDATLAIPNVHLCYEDINKAVNNYDQLVAALKDSRNIMNTLGMIMTDEGYSKSEKLKRIEFMMEVHMNDVFLRVEDLLKKGE